MILEAPIFPHMVKFFILTSVFFIVLWSWLCTVNLSLDSVKKVDIVMRMETEEISWKLSCLLMIRHNLLWNNKIIIDQSIYKLIDIVQWHRSQNIKIQDFCINFSIKSSYIKIYKLAINTKMGHRLDDRASNNLLRVFDADSGFKLTKIGSEINYKVEKENQDFFKLYRFQDLKFK